MPWGWTADEVLKEVAGIRKAIVRGIGTEWVLSDTHARFFARIATQRGRRHCDLFSLNYDTIIEATLEHLCLPHVDGFRGAENAYFDPAMFETAGQSSPIFRVHKLHGSINWTRDKDQMVRRRPAKGMEDSDRLVIYPCEQKATEAQYGVYELLLDRFRDRLRDPRPNNKLIVIGYSFNDEHINVAIEDSLRTPGSNLTVHAFLGPEADTASQTQRIRAIAERCDNRFNAAMGSDTFIGAALTEDEWDKMKARDLWKYENLVDLVVGGK